MDGLVQRVAERDSAAWHELYERFKREVLALCLAILKDKEDALDAAQETFLKALEHAAIVKTNGNLRAWLLKIAANTCKSRLRKEKYKQQLLKLWTVGKKWALYRNSVEDQVRDARLTELVRGALDELPEKYRIPLVLRFYADMDYAQICGIVSEWEGEPITEATIGSRINRAKEKLRAKLEQRGVSPL